MEQVKDGTLLDGKFEEYEQAFKAADTTGNGFIGAAEINQLFIKLGHPLRPEVRGALQIHVAYCVTVITLLPWRKAWICWSRL